MCRLFLLLLLSGVLVRLEETSAAEFLRNRAHNHNDDDSVNDSNIDIKSNLIQEKKELEEISLDRMDGIEKREMTEKELDMREMTEKELLDFYKTNAKKRGKKSKSSKQDGVKVDFMYGLDGELEPVLTEDELESHIKENQLGKKEADALRRAGPLPKGIFKEKRDGDDGNGGVIQTEEELENLIKENNIGDEEADVFRALRPYRYYYNYRHRTRRRCGYYGCGYYGFGYVSGPFGGYGGYYGYHWYGQRKRSNFYYSYGFRNDRTSRHYRSPYYSY